MSTRREVELSARRLLLKGKKTSAMKVQAPLGPQSLSQNSAHNHAAKDAPEA